MWTPERAGRTVVIGVGNPTLTDDGVGIHAARAVHDRLAALAVDGVDVVVLGAGGLRLMESMVGYETAIVLDALDALEVGDLPAGTVAELGAADLAASRNLTAVHDLSLPCALKVGRATGLAVPERVHVLGVRVADVTTFGEELSPQVAGAVAVLVARVLELLPPPRSGLALAAV